MAAMTDQKPIEPSGDHVRVVVADDHPGARRILRGVLEAEPWCEVEGESDTSSGEMLAQRLTPDVVVLDLDQSRGSAIALIRRMHAAAPWISVVSATMEESPTLALVALDAGASAVVLKHRADAELPAAVACAARREEYVSPQVSPGLERLRRERERRERRRREQT